MRKKAIIALMMACLPIIAYAQGAGGYVRKPVNKQQTMNTGSVKMQHPMKGNQLRVIRGGRWNGYAKDYSVSDRFGFSPSSTYDYLGLRLAL